MEVLGSLIVPKSAQASPPASPVSGQLWFDTTVNQLKWYDGTEWVSSSGTVPAVAAFPTFPVVGQLCLITADKSNGVKWLFTYDGEGEYPWKFVGGPPLSAEVETEQTTASTTFTNLTTEGPTISTPLAGTYDITIKSMMTNTAINIHSRMSYTTGATGTTAATVADCMDTLDAGNAFTVANNVRTKRRTFTAAQKLIAKYLSTNASGEAKFANRVIEALPIRAK